VFASGFRISSSQGTILYPRKRTVKILLPELESLIVMILSSQKIPLVLLAKKKQKKLQPGTSSSSSSSFSIFVVSSWEISAFSSLPQIARVLQRLS
jgi:hypothetical protein